MSVSCRLSLDACPPSFTTVARLPAARSVARSEPALDKRTSDDDPKKPPPDRSGEAEMEDSSMPVKWPVNMGRKKSGNIASAKKDVEKEDAVYQVKRAVRGVLEVPANATACVSWGASRGDSFFIDAANPFKVLAALVRQ